jgi:hypothetical protein
LIESKLNINDEIYNSYIDDYNKGNMGLVDLIDNLKNLSETAELNAEQFEKVTEAY